MAVDRDEMIRTAAMNLLRIADALEQAEVPEDTEAVAVVEAPVAAVKFKCDGCDHVMDLDGINAKNKEFAGDVEVDPLTAEDKIRCPVCGKGVMSADVPDHEDGDADDDAGLDTDDDDDDDDGSEDQDMLDKAEQPATAVEGPGLTGHPAEANPMAQPMMAEAPVAEAPVAEVAVVGTPETEEEETPEHGKEETNEEEEEVAEHTREAFMQAVRMASFRLEV